jgi:hypothetical protein
VLGSVCSLFLRKKDRILPSSLTFPYAHKCIFFYLSNAAEAHTAVSLQDDDLQQFHLEYNPLHWHAVVEVAVVM